MSQATAKKRPRWRRDPAGRRERILAAAARLFGERGYHSVRTAEITSAAGVSEGMLYHHFGSKQGTLVAVAERYGRGFTRAMFADIDPGRGLPNVETAIRHAFAYVRHSDPLFGVFLLTDDPTEPKIARSANRDAIVSSLASMFETWRTRKLIGDVNSRIVAELCFGLVEAALKECYVRGKQADEETYVREVVRGIRALLSPADAGD